jgi:hypothetical protein
MDQVKIIAAETWGLQNGLFDKEKGWPMADNPTLDNIFFVIKGQKEYVVLADNTILETLKALPSTGFIQKLSVIEKYLIGNGIAYTKTD